MEIQHDNVEDIVDNWDHSIDLREEDDLYKLLQVVARENQRIDLDIEYIYDNKFVNTATGKELEKIGELVGVRRKTAEPDTKLRKRIKGEFAVQASDTTFKQFASIALTLLETEPEGIEIHTPPETAAKVVEIQIDGSVIDDNALTKSELIDMLNRVVSIDARVNIIETGTFAFSGGDESLLGWDEGTWSVIVNN
jgi:uncharacterized phage protein gp47/JayE